MSDGILRALTGDAEQATVTLRRRFRAPASDVWDAITRPDRVARWFGTIQGPAPTRPGDAFLVDIGQGTVRRAVLERCDRPERLALTWWSGDDDPGAVVFRLREDEGGTELTVTHDRLRRHRLVGCGAGWEASLGSLAASLDGVAAETVSRTRWEDLQLRPLEITTRLAAPRGRVWDAWTTVDGLSAWWWDHWSPIEIALDPRVGGRYRFAAPAQGLAVEGEYLVIDPSRRLAFTWEWTDADGTSADEAVEVAFADDDGGTLLTIRHTGPWPDDAPAASYRQGWTFVLAALERTLDTLG